MAKLQLYHKTPEEYKSKFSYVDQNFWNHSGTITGWLIKLPDRCDYYSGLVRGDGKILSQTLRSTITLENCERLSEFTPVCKVEERKDNYSSWYYNLLRKSKFLINSN